MIEIYKPKWEGNSIRRIGLAEYRLKLEGAIVEINITYRNKEGLRLYPDPFYMRKVDIVGGHYPVENASGTKVYVIPIADLSTSPTLEHKYVEYDQECPKCKIAMRQNLHKKTVSYICPKCGEKSFIEWILGEEIQSIATKDEKGLDISKETPVNSKVEADNQPNLF
jgi:Zn-finger nucleic acid-binding protein